MSDTDPENPEWLWDEVPQYRLNDQIIHKYLSEHWEGYNFFIEVNAYSPSALNSDQHCAAKRRQIQVLGSAKTQKGILPYPWARADSQNALPATLILTVA